MNHTEAIRRGCTERYLLEEMDQDERHEFEEHFFECRECAEDLKVTTAFLDNGAEVVREEAQSQVAEAAAAALGWAWLRNRRLDSGWLAAAILVLLCGTAYQSLFVVPELRRSLEAAQGPQAVRWEFLSVSRSRAPEVVVPPDHRMVGFRLSQSSEKTFPEYLCEVRDEDGRRIEGATLPAPPTGGELELVLPLEGLDSGIYVLVLSGIEPLGGPVVAPEIARYRFRLRLTEEDS